MRRHLEEQLGAPYPQAPAPARRGRDPGPRPGARAPDERVAARPRPPRPRTFRSAPPTPTWPPTAPPSRAKADPLLGVLAALGSIPRAGARWRNSSSARPRTTGAAPTPGWPSSTPWPGSRRPRAGPAPRGSTRRCSCWPSPGGGRRAAGARLVPGRRLVAPRPAGAAGGSACPRRCGRWPASAPGASAPSTTCASCRRSSVASPTWPSSGWRSSPRPALPSGCGGPPAPAATAYRQYSLATGNGLVARALPCPPGRDGGPHSVLPGPAG